MEIAVAGIDDLGAIRQLLETANLPFADITAAHLNDFIVARDDSRLVGAVGFERYGDDGLLRSLVVDTEARGTGVGGHLVQAIIGRATKSGLSSLVLLTTTAKEFFSRRGFSVINRDDMPDAVKSSTEFTSLCPSSATCMKKSIVKSSPPRVLFVCVENSNRSQMAEGFAKAISGGDVEALSAGSRPSGSVNPRAIQMMAERGIDLTAQSSKSLDEVGDATFDAVITMGCGDACPWLPAKRRVDWALPDPKELDDEGFRRVRDDIETRVRDLLSALQT